MVRKETEQRLSMKNSKLAQNIPKVTSLEARVMIIIFLHLPTFLYVYMMGKNVKMDSLHLFIVSKQRLSYAF
jgi:hypothetical protein